jgi:hypothetical protein
MLRGVDPRMTQMIADASVGQTSDETGDASAEFGNGCFAAVPVTSWRLTGA